MAGCILLSPVGFYFRDLAQEHLPIVKAAYEYLPQQFRGYLQDIPTEKILS
jgi:hypothetical protein